MPPNTWVRAYFSEFPKCDILLNNNCEVFNSYILEARELPILSMLERIKCQLMTRHYNKQQDLGKDIQGAFCPKIRKKLAKNAEFENMCFASPSRHGVFQVQIKDYQHIVDINARTCDCRRWQLTGVPCWHAISCLRSERIQPQSVLAICYSLEAYKNSYGFNIWPCKDKSEWEKVNGPEVKPPVYVKKAGRPPKSRRKQPQEVQGKDGPRLSRHGVVIHCKFCSDANHNSSGCKLKKMGFTSEEAKKLVATTRATLAQEVEQQAAEATTVQQAAVEEHHVEDLPISQELRQEGQAETMTQASTSVLSQMLGEVIYIN